jgi:hypothetical protein
MKKKFIAAACLAFCVPSFAWAQASCNGNESINQCFERIVLKGETPGKEARSAQVQEETNKQKASVNDALKAALAGANSGGAVTAATLNDLAPIFDALGLLSSGDSDEGTLAFNLNALIPVQNVDNNNTQLKLVVNTQPQPLDQLVQAFPETVRATRKDTLQKDISTFGDAQLLLNWSLVNGHFGRDFSVLRPLLAPIYDGAVVRGRAAASTAATIRFQNARNTLADELDKANDARQRATPPQPAVPISANIDDLPIPSNVKAEIVQATLDAAEETTVGRQFIESELVRTRIVGLADLVQQQPQLIFSLSHDIRDEIVGPEKTSATVTWEMTRRNVSAFLNGPGGACKSKDVGNGKDEYDRCVSALQNYLSDGGAGLQQQWRFKLAASYQRVKSVTYSYASDGVSLSLPDTDRWEVAFAAGRPLGGAAGKDRIDVEFAYDSNLDNDTTNKERVKATLTYTKHMDTVDLPLSIVYANKSEFLGEVDHQISLHFGLKFRQSK